MHQEILHAIRKISREIAIEEIEKAEARKKEAPPPAPVVVADPVFGGGDTWKSTPEKDNI